MQTITYINKTFPNLEFEVSYVYFYEPERWYLSNGDPGHPESEEVSIEKIVITNYNKEDLYDLLYLGENILDDIENYIIELERENR